MKSAKRADEISAVELLGLTGFAFLLAWMFVSFFWLFRDFPPEVPLATRDLSQLAIFAGMPVGYVLMHLLGRMPRFNLFSTITTGVELVCGLSLPIVAFAIYQNVHVPLPVVCVTNFLGGATSALLTVSWLDVLSRLRTTSYDRFTGLAFVGGSLLFALAMLAPDAMQPVFSFAYLLFSICLLIFATQNADGNDERAPLESTEDATWRFTKEIEPSFFVFGIVFALNFVFLFNNGTEALLPGLFAVIPGALLVALMAICGKQVDITVVQRWLLVITVLSCLLLPFSDGVLQLGCACLVVAAWAAFKTTNYAFVVRKSTLTRSTPLFRQAPMRLFVSSLGFAVGFVTMAFVLVVVVMAFFPIGRHHLADGTSRDEGALNADKVVVQMDESELFEERCQAIVRLYQLSPREADILAYLAKGRNAAWIQEELTISPHTVKSHIYNIYRKLDIHSQQKLMSFVEEFPFDL